MNSNADRVLAIAEMPTTLEEMGTRLSAISEAITDIGNREGKTKTLNRDFTALIDLWTKADLALAADIVKSPDNHPLKSTLAKTLEQDRDFPATDPLTMLAAGARYKVIPRDQAKAMQAEFMAKAREAAGHDLTEAQVRKLFRLFRHYNPVGNITPR